MRRVLKSNTDKALVDVKGDKEMVTNKKESIKTSLQGLGPKLGELYTNQQMIDKSIEMQAAIADCISELAETEKVNGRDLRKQVLSIAEEHGLENDESFLRLDKGLDELGYTIASFIKGQKGERIAKNALRLLQYDNGVKIIYNIALEDEESQAEYDAIVIAPYGIFVVEVKNWSGDLVIDEWGMLHRDANTDIQYDVPGRMNIKECLLRECLGEHFPKHYESILLFSNNNARIRDNFKQFKICFGGAIVQVIRANNNGEEILSESERNEIASALMTNHKAQYTESKIDCDKIIDDLSIFISKVVPSPGEITVEIMDNPTTEITGDVSAHRGTTKKNTIRNRMRQVDWRQVGSFAAEVLLLVGSVVLSSEASINVTR